MNLNIIELEGTFEFEGTDARLKSSSLTLYMKRFKSRER